MSESDDAAPPPAKVSTVLRIDAPSTGQPKVIRWVSAAYTSRTEAVAALLDVADLAAIQHEQDSERVDIDPNALFDHVVAALYTLGVGQFDLDAAEALRARRLP